MKDTGPTDASSTYPCSWWHGSCRQNRLDRAKRASPPSRPCRQTGLCARGSSCGACAPHSCTWNSRSSPSHTKPPQAGHRPTQFGSASTRRPWSLGGPSLRESHQSVFHPDWPLPPAMSAPSDGTRPHRNVLYRENVRWLPGSPAGQHEAAILWTGVLLKLRTATIGFKFIVCLNKWLIIWIRKKNNSWLQDKQASNI